MADPSLSVFAWSVADLLRGDCMQPEYGKVILPFTVLRRLDCVLERTKEAVLGSEAGRAVAMLQERRMALLSAVITDQIDGRALLEAKPA